MRIRFKKTKVMEKYTGFFEDKPVNFLDGEEKDVPVAKGEQLLRDYSEFFTAVNLVKEIEKPPRDKMIKKAKTKKF